MWFKNKNTNQKLTKSVTVYLSDLHRQIIIAPRYATNDRVLYEQDICTLLSYPIDCLQLGSEVLRNFNMFALKDKNLRDQRLTDWPAFKYSKMKSVKAFEKTFTGIEIYGNNESNIIISIQTPIISDSDLLITSSISVNASKEAIGNLIIKVYNKALLA
jgi:hypothetical protein